MNFVQWKKQQEEKNTEPVSTPSQNQSFEEWRRSKNGSQPAAKQASIPSDSFLAQTLRNAETKRQAEVIMESRARNNTRLDSDTAVKSAAGNVQSKTTRVDEEKIASLMARQSELVRQGKEMTDEYDNVSMELLKAQRQNKALDKNLPGVAERVGKTVAGGLKNSASSYVNTVGTLGEVARNAGNELERANGEINKGGNFWESLINNMATTPAGGTATTDLLMNTLKGAADTDPTPIYAAADELSKGGQRDIERAKEGAGALGGFVVDAGASGTQMLGDAVFNAVLPGSGLGAMGVRAFGSAAQTARQRGADILRQIGYGAAVAGVEVLSEKLFDGLAGLYGGGGADKVVEELINKLAKTYAGRKTLNVIAGMSGEAIEEMFSGAINPALDAIIDGKTTYSEDTVTDILYDAAVGGFLGGLGSGTQVMHENISEGRNATDTNVGNKSENVSTGNENIDTLLEVSEKVRKNTPAPEEDGVSTLVETVEKLNNKTASTEETAERAGQATIIKNRYEGIVPQYNKPADRIKPNIDSNALSVAREQIEKAKKNSGGFKRTLRKFYEALFDNNGGQRNISVKGTSAEDNPYIVSLYKSAVGKVVNDSNLTAEKLAVFNNIDEIIENGEYVGSGKYISHSEKKKHTIRFDYFETPVTIDGKEYIVTFDVEIFPDTNNYRTHKVINEMDLVSNSRTDTGSNPPQGLQKQDPSNESIPHSTDSRQEENSGAPETSQRTHNGGFGANGMAFMLAHLEESRNDAWYSAAERVYNAARDGRSIEGIDTSPLSENDIQLAIEAGERDGSAEAVFKDNNGQDLLNTIGTVPSNSSIQAAPALTETLDKLGVKIEGSAADYGGVDQIKAQRKEVKKLERQIRKREHNTSATESEKRFAADIAAGTYTEADIPESMDKDTVTELSDLYRARNALNNEQLQRKRSEIKDAYRTDAEELFKDSDNGKPMGILRLNYSTPERAMRAMFGDELGGRIYNKIFKPVSQNEAERIRFVNKMISETDTIEDSSGKKRRLTMNERKLVQMIMEGKAAEEYASGLETSKSVLNAAENIKNGANAADAAREFSLSDDEKTLAEQMARWMNTKEIIESGDYDQTILDNAAKIYQEKFAQFYDAINDFLVAHGYEPIGWIRGYTPHMQNENNLSLLNSALSSLGINTGVAEIPTSIAGRTADYKPNKRWNPYFLERTGNVTDYDIVNAFQSYVDFMSDVLYHTDDTMRVREVSNYFRKKYSPENIKENISWADNLRSSSAEEKLNFLRMVGEVDGSSIISDADVLKLFDRYIDKQYEDIKKTTKYNDFVMWLDNYANMLAGKQSMADRGSEYLFGRKALNAGNSLVKVFARSAVGGNLSSVANQVAQLPQIVSETGQTNTMQALRDIVRGRIGIGAWAQQSKLLSRMNEESDFLTAKGGIDYNTEGDTGFEKAITLGFKPAEVVDSIISQLAVRAKYLQEVDNGSTHEEAMKTADSFGEHVMGSRAKGTKPLAFQSKNLIAQMTNVFQLEALNGYQHVFEDLPREVKRLALEKGAGEAAKWIAALIMKMLISTFLLNRVTEEIYGGTPAQLDLLGFGVNFLASGSGMSTNSYLKNIADNGIEKITGERPFGTYADANDDDFDTERALMSLGENVANDIPLVSNISALAGVGDKSLPLPNVGDSVKNIYDTVTDDGIDNWNLGKAADTGKAILGAAAEVVPMGKQIKKSALGAEAFARGGDYTGYGEDEKLKYPIEQNVPNFLQSVLFGKYATGESKDYYASDGRALSAKRTKLWNELKEQGVEWNEFNEIKDKYSELNSIKELTAAQQRAQFSKWLDDEGYDGDVKDKLLDEFTFYTSIPSTSDMYSKLTAAGLNSDTAEIIAAQLAKRK